MDRSRSPQLEAFKQHLDQSAVLLDLDGTIGPMASHPDLVALQPGAAAVIAKLVPRVIVLGVISGRRRSDLSRLVTVPGVQLVGLYGNEDRSSESETAIPDALLHGVEETVASIEGAWVERKGPALAIHFRTSTDPVEASRMLARTILPLARDAGLAVMSGKRVLELFPGDPSLKGDVVARIVSRSGARAVLYAGDDLADLSAFDALDAIGANGHPTVRIAVEGEETPAELLEAADVVVQGPGGLVRLLEDLADRSDVR
jgi:trehalose 6-phosphate phosphatase